MTIDRYGLITASGTAQLNDINAITVRAAYHGKVYEAVFGITKARGGTPGRGIWSVVFWYYQSASATALTGGSWIATVPARTNGKYIWQKSVTTYTDGTSSETEPVCITGEQGADSGRYRGVTNIADTGNTGTATLTSGGDAVMNDLDWVLFMGTADWTNARLYRWYAVERVWKKMEPAQHLSHYMDVLETITEDAADGIFSTVFCRALFAQQAAIETLQARLIKIANAIYGGERFTRDGNTVVDNGADKTGFKLGADGRLIASNVEISGTVNANFGSFDNISIGSNAFFSGTINSGPLYASNENSATVSGNIYNSNTSVRSVWESLSGADGIPYPGSGQTFAVVSGTYGDKSGLLSLVFYHGGAINPITNMGVDTYSLRLNFADGTSIDINSGVGRYNPSLGATLEVGGGQPGKTLKFNDLPVGDGGLQAGTVYRTSDGSLKVKI